MAENDPLAANLAPNLLPPPSKKTKLLQSLKATNEAERKAKDEMVHQMDAEEPVQGGTGAGGRGGAKGEGIGSAQGAGTGRADAEEHVQGRPGASERGQDVRDIAERGDREEAGAINSY